MLRRFLSLFVFLPLAVLLVAFTVANRHAVVVSFDPFSAGQPAFALEMPLFFVMFVCLLTGVLAGGIATWFGQGRWRRQARAGRTQAARARREADAMRAAAGPALPAPGTRV